MGIPLIFDSSLKLSYINGEFGLSCQTGTHSVNCYYLSDCSDAQHLNDYNYYLHHLIYTQEEIDNLHKHPAFIVGVE